MSNRYRITANFPSLKPAHEATQVVIGVGKNWATALADGCRKLRKLPQLKRRRISAVSLTIVKLEEAEAAGPSSDTDPGHQQDMRFGGTLDERGE